MSTRDINEILEITTSDTISTFMEKCNINFKAIVGMGGGPEGPEGGKGNQGVPTKPKVPIHVWREGIEYNTENNFTISSWNENLNDVKYQEGHLIVLANAHVYTLKLEGTELKPDYMLTLRSYDPDSIINGRNAFVHIAYADDANGNGFVKQGDVNNIESISTFSLRRTSNNVVDKPYMGICANSIEDDSKLDFTHYTWARIQGGSGYSVMLSNPIAVIPVGDDWRADENMENQYDSTLVYLYNTTSDISSNPKVEISLPPDNEYVKNKNFTIDEENGINKVIFKPVVGDSIFDFGENAQYKLPITLTYDLGEDADNDNVIDKFSATINWTLAPIKGLCDVEVFVDKRVVNTSSTDKHLLRVGYYLTSTNESKKFIGKYDSDENTQEYKIFLTSDIGDLSSGEVVDWLNAEYDFVDENRVNRNCYVVLTDKNNNTIDYINVTSVKDGNTAVHLELTQDYIGLPCNANGDGIHPDYNTDEHPIYLQMKLYNGDKLIEDYENIKYDFRKIISDKNDTDINDYIENGDSGVFYISRDIITGDTNIECVATYKGTSYSKILFIDLEQTPYELEINKNVLTRDENVGGIIDESLIVRVKYWSNGDWVYTPDGIVTATTESDEHTYYFDEPTGQKYDRIFTISGSKLEDNTKDIEVKVSYYINDKELTYETIGIVSNGIDGENWQYIFCKSSSSDFNDSNISDPSKWEDDKPKDPNNILLGDKGKPDSDWHADHTGVDSINKYEYQSYRKWNRLDKCWGKYCTPTLYSNYSESGSGYSVILSNPISVIPVGNDDWKTNENNSNQSDYTLVYLYSNTSDMSDDTNVSIDFPKNKHFTPDKDANGVNKVVFKPVADDGSVFDFGSNAQYKLPITLKYESNDENLDDFSTTVYWTLSPMKGLEDVELFVDKRVVNTTSDDDHTFRVGYYLISTNNSKKFVEKDNEKNVKGYKIILNDSIENISSGIVVDDWQNANYDFNIDGVNRNCYVILTESDGASVIDYAIITAVSDGKDGASAIHLELTQDYIGVPCSADGGSVHPDFTDTIGAQMKLYDGDTLIEDFENIKYSFKINDVETEGITSTPDGIFEVSNNLIIGDTNIECIAEYKGTSYYKTLFIDLENTPYELEINKSVLSRNMNSNKIIDDNLTVNVKYWMGGKWIYTDKDVVKATISSSTENIYFGEPDPNSNKHDRTLKINGSESILENNTKDIEVRISYLKEDELSYKNISITDEYTIHLELTKNYIEVPTNVNSDGSDPDFTDSITSQMKLYDGSVLITDYDNIKYSFKINGVETKNITPSLDGTFEVPIDLITGDTSIECIASYNDVSYKKMLTIHLDNKPYALELDKNILTRDVKTGKITDDTLTVRVKYWEDGGWKYVNTTSYIKVSTSNGNKTNNIKNTHISDGMCEWVISLNNIGIDFNTSTYFNIEYYSLSFNQKADSYETISIIDIPTLNFELTKNYIEVPTNVNSDGSDPDFTDSITSQMKLYDGSVLITDYDNIKYSFKINGVETKNITPSLDGTFEVPIDLITGDTSIECIAEYNDVSYKKMFTIHLDTDPYVLEFNKNILTRNENTGNIIDDVLTIRAKYWENGAWKYVNEPRYIKVSNSNGNKTSSIENTYISDDIYEWSISLNDIDIDFNTSTHLKIEYYQYSTSLVSLSYETISIIDIPTLNFELTQNYFEIPCNADGNSVHPDFTDSITSQMKLYNGNKLVEDYNNIEYTFKINDEVTENIIISTDGTFEVPHDLIIGDTNIECIAKYKGTSYHKTIFIYLKETPHILEFNKNILTRDVNDENIIDDNLIVRVKYWADGEWKYTSEGVVKAYIPNDQENIYFEKPNGESYDRILIIGGSNSILENNTEDVEIKISYFKETILSYETIGIVNSGKDGDSATPPYCTNVEILGYSKSKLDIDSNDWCETLNDLLPLDPQQTIYILNEYTWSDGKTTKGITVTLAGTQGVAGKSRVLFYLGSFYDGTLSGNTVPGTLNDERCDYYIDKSDQAWMRTGEAGSKPGNSTGNEGSPYWVKSEKVGFLQAGAIHANMINTDTITANSALVTTLFAQEVTADKLTVKAAKIDGKLTGKQIEAKTITADLIATGVIPEDLDIDWLKTSFNNGSTILSNGLILSTFIAVSGDNGPESGLNSSTKIKSGRDDYDDKKLLFFAGSDGLKTSLGGNTNISSDATSGYTSNAKIEFFSDGSGYVAGDRFKWDNTGKATIQNLTIENSILNGSIRSPFKHVYDGWNWGTNDPDTQDMYDNLYCSIGEEIIPWTWTNDNIGRHVTLVHNNGGNQITDYGSCSISAPSGYCFFEDGVARKKLNFSNEILDLIGYGNEQGTFHGWIVNKRDNIMTKSKYGHALKCLCFGRVIFNSDSVYISNLKTFDGTSTSSSYHISQRFSITSNTNYCTITMPECWFNGSANKNLYVELSPVYNTRIPQVALGSISDNSFTVYVDKSPASFDFMLYNKNDWFSFTGEFAYDKIVYVENTSTAYRSIWLSNISGDLGYLSGFATNASNGLTVEYISGDASWVNYSISNGKLTASTTAGNTTASDRSCIVRIKPKSLESNEIIKDGITNYIDVTLGQFGTSSGGGGWT